MSTQESGFSFPTKNSNDNYNRRKRLYNEKELYFKKNKIDEVAPFDFYRDLFPVGSFEREGHKEDSRGNGMLLQLSNSKEKKTPHRYIIFDDLNVISEHMKQKNVFISPCGYFGRSKSLKNLRFIYAIAIDIDLVGKKEIANLFYQFDVGIIPKPTYVIDSGGGLHLYYAFYEPVPAYPQNQKVLKFLKDNLTDLVWTCYTSQKDIEHQGISQAFRAPGTQTKIGADKLVKAYKTGEKVFPSYLSDFVPDAVKNEINAITDGEDRTPVAKARELWPDWYKRRVIEKQPRGSWKCSRGLYDWWLSQICAKAQEGHRYNCIHCLAIYGAKCSIPPDEIKADALSLLPFLDALTSSKENHFTQQDIETALQGDASEMVRLTGREISRLSGINIEHNKRNKKSRSEHLLEVRTTQNKYDANALWRNGDGAPTKQIIVKEWKKQHLAGKKADCIRETGLSKKTVYKWWSVQSIF